MARPGPCPELFWSSSARSHRCIFAAGHTGLHYAFAPGYDVRWGGTDRLPDEVNFGLPDFKVPRP